MERLGSLDAVFLAIETPTSPMNVGSLGIFEGPAPSRSAVSAFVGAKLQQAPRCRQRVHESAGEFVRPVWIDDVGFDVRDHVHSARLYPGRTVEQFVEQVMPQPLDRARPLWEMWVVTGLADGRWAVLSKMHHCMVDGVAGTDLLAMMMDPAPDAVLPAVIEWAPADDPSTAAIALHSAAAMLSSICGHVRGLVRLLTHPSATWRALRRVLTGAKDLWLQPSRRDSTLTGPIGRHRRWAHTSVTLRDVSTVRHAFGGTVNDVVLTAVARGFRVLLDSRGEPVTDRDVMALVPVSVRGTDEHGRLDNRVAVTHALLPVGIDDPVATLAALRRHMDELKASHETDASTVLLHTGDFLPFAIAATVSRAVVGAQKNLETIATNVPGPQQPLYLCGRRMLEAYPFAPIAGRIRISIAIWSYCGSLSLGVTADGDSVTDLDVLVRGIEIGFDDLLRAATSGGE